MAVIGHQYGVFRQRFGCELTDGALGERLKRQLLGHVSFGPDAATGAELDEVVGEQLGDFFRIASGGLRLEALFEFQ